MIVEVSEARDLVLKMYRENEERYDLSAFEKGRMFTRWLDASVYESQRELAAAIGLGEAAAAKYLAVAGLPKEVLAAFGDERVIPMSWGPTLSQAVKTNEAAVLRSAERLTQRKPPATPEVVLRTLLAAAAGKNSASRGTSREELKDWAEAWLRKRLEGP